MKNLQNSYPSKLYVETTTRCNLRCSMCVKQTKDARIPEVDMSMEVFQKLEPAFPHINTLLLNGIGEPLLARNLVAMIEHARKLMAPDAIISFQTNGMLLTFELAKKLVAAGLDRICISIDMVDENEILHGGEDIGRIKYAFEYLRRASEVIGRKLSIGVEFVLMRNNAASLPYSLQWAAEQGAEFALVTHMLPYSDAMANQELFNPNTERSLTEFERWQDEAKERGFNLEKYFDVLWKVKKTEDEMEFINFVNERMKAALSDGIPMHLAYLIQWTTEEKRVEQTWLASIFEKAQEIAGKYQLDLTLPPITASYERKCDFVEQGVAHITPTGDVHPCYFLWHEYSCFMDGDSKKVTPQSFGNINDSSIIEIWNSEEYQNFRTQVLKYEYPYCTNCSVVPCVDVTGHNDPFEMDCYGTTVPCGHCLWGMGGVRCLL
ncbi:radical SAM/SPASM family putative metalloenzyme maturase [Halodesulfovibrio marinisediminis]|uniref:Putative metalloenzyme radical SAM/SPASM domain maturase n=1 Tax=Halodesulfovibrio marinisediminis DSM 17456 TaxID=1121457 RepID=A0A1N6DVK5_9BACT|nr:radical SAM/SPASM family putative metalloenzyme maturase [Halodesulfovibrio marinisediminis]SIN74819.1 putative metalloenzyme radical SAM/SPASM domain maturase [Halodesulfovibrio marinisediminis DSM 17456]